MLGKVTDFIITPRDSMMKQLVVAVAKAYGLLNDALALQQQTIDAMKDLFNKIGTTAQAVTGTSDGGTDPGAMLDAIIKTDQDNKAIISTKLTALETGIKTIMTSLGLGA